MLPTCDVQLGARATEGRKLRVRNRQSNWTKVQLAVDVCPGMDAFRGIRELDGRAIAVRPMEARPVADTVEGPPTLPL